MLLLLLLKPPRGVGLRLADRRLLDGGLNCVVVVVLVFAQAGHRSGLVVEFSDGFGEGRELVSPRRRRRANVCFTLSHIE